MAINNNQSITGMRGGGYPTTVAIINRLSLAHNTEERKMEYDVEDLTEDEMHLEIYWDNFYKYFEPPYNREDEMEDEHE